MTHLRDFFAAIEWWRLEPAPELVKNQAQESPRKMAVSWSANGDLLVAYLPDNAEIVLDLSEVREGLVGRWFNPVSGQSVSLSAPVSPQPAVTLLGHSSSERIGTLVTDVVHQTLSGGLTEIKMSEPVLDALIALRSYLFDAVYENQVATAEFAKAAGILGGLWEKVTQRPEDFLDLRTVEAEGVAVAAQDFVAGMTDRYAVRLFEELFIPKPWVEIGRRPD